MRVYQYLLISAIVCAQLKYSFSQVAEVFSNCVNDGDCPDNSECFLNTVSGENNCRCEDGFDAIDMSFTSNGEVVTACLDLGPCSQFDNEETDCGTNGRCVTYTDQYGTYRSFCRCRDGYYGPNCNLQGPSTWNPMYTTRSPYYTTRRPGNIGGILPIIGGGAALLILLAAGGAALASSAG